MASEYSAQSFPGSFTVEVEHGFMAFADSREKCLEIIYETIQKYETVCILKKTFTTSYHDAGGGHVIYMLANSSWDDRLKEIIGKDTCGGSFLFDKPEVRHLSGLEEPPNQWNRDDVYKYASPPVFSIVSDEASAAREWARYDEDVSCLGIFTLTNIGLTFRNWRSQSWAADHAREWEMDSQQVRREYEIYPVRINEINRTSGQHLYCYRVHLLNEEPVNRAE